MIEIGVPDYNDSLIEATLDGTVFYLHMSWNSAAKYWVMGIQNAEGTDLINGVMVRPNYPLLLQFRSRIMPLGDLYVFNSGESTISRESFVNGEAVLMYMDESDLADAGVLQTYGKL